MSLRREPERPQPANCNAKARATITHGARSGGPKARTAYCSVMDLMSTASQARPMRETPLPW